jgi:hypothetical protein
MSRFHLSVKSYSKAEQRLLRNRETNIEQTISYTPAPEA